MIPSWCSYFFEAFWKPVEVSHVKMFGKSISSRVNGSARAMSWGWTWSFKEQKGDCVAEAQRWENQAGKHEVWRHRQEPKGQGLVHCSCCCCSVTQSCLTLCNPMGCNTPGLPVLHHLPKFAQVHVHGIGYYFIQAEVMELDAMMLVFFNI